MAATYRRAIFIGPETYAEAGGTIIRDLFTEDRGGFYEDATLLDQLVIEKLEGIAAQVQETEGWKWVDAHIDCPHDNGMRRSYPQPVELSEEDEAAYAAAKDEYDRLTAEWEGTDDDLPPDVDQCFAELEAEIEDIDAKRHAYDPDDITRGGVYVVLSHDGEARIERGFIRPQDEAPEPDEAEDDETVIDGVRINGDGEVIEDGEYDGDGNHVSALDAEDEEAEEDGKPLSDLLIRDLTAHRMLGLRLALGEQPDMALIAVTHALAAQTFYRGVDAHCLEIRPSSLHLGGHADGIEDTAAAKALEDRHAGWASDMPRDVADLWGFITGLDQASVMAPFAHCASLTVNALKLSWENKPRAYRTADRLATAVVLDMTAHWTPTVRTYLGRVTKAHSLSELVERPFVLLDLPQSSAWLLALFDFAGQRPRISFRTRSYETVCAAVACGFGFSILNMRPIGQGSPDSDELVRKALTDDLPVPHLIVADRYGTAKPSFLRRFTNLAQAFFKEVGPDHLTVARS